MIVLLCVKFTVFPKKLVPIFPAESFVVKDI